MSSVPRPVRLADDPGERVCPLGVCDGSGWILGPEDVAIVAYKVNERVVVDGKTLPIEANDSSVWVCRDGEWLCALHTESLAGDPYGRDRRV